MATGIGERIRRVRTRLEWSQEDLARHMGLKSKSTICKVERGEDNLTTTAVKKYADALGVSPSFLMGWEDNMDNSFEVLEREGAEFCTLQQESESIAKAKALYKMYEKASPEVQQAVELMLKSAQPKP